MRGIVERQLGGTLAMDWSSEGLQANVTISWPRPASTAE
jgi:hypothetical protein